MPNPSSAKGTVLQAASVYRLRPGAEADAVKAAKDDGADNVFVRAGQDLFVLSGRGMDLSRTRPGDRMVVKGRQGVVVAVDDQVNSAGDGGKRFVKTLDGAKDFVAQSAIVGGVASGVIFAQQGVAFGASASALATGTTAGAIVGGATVGLWVLGAVAVGAGVVAGGTALHGTFRHADLHAMAAFSR